MNRCILQLQETTATMEMYIFVEWMYTTTSRDNYGNVYLGKSQRMDVYYNFRDNYRNVYIWKCQTMDVYYNFKRQLWKCVCLEMSKNG